MSRKIFVTVSRGMTDNTPVCVYPWEMDVLRLVHGGAVEEVSIEQMCTLKGAVKVERQKQKHSSVAPPDLRAQLEGMAWVDPEFDPANDPAAEYDRLATVYGMDKEFPVPCVERVYGRFEAGGFEAKVKQFAKERGPKPAHLEEGGDGEPLANMSREELRDACRERGIAFKATDGRDELVRKLGVLQAA